MLTFNRGLLRAVLDIHVHHFTLLSASLMLLLSKVLLPQLVQRLLLSKVQVSLVTLQVMQELHLLVREARRGLHTLPVILK